MCRALSVESRARLLGLLRAGPLCVGALAARLGLTQGAVSQHLKVLREAGLVRPRKIGYFTHYGLEAGALRALQGMIGGKMPEHKKEKKAKGGGHQCAAAKRSARSRRN
jgi:DNA-binding transcriptional ArsR family regulator